MLPVLISLLAWAAHVAADEGCYSSVDTSVSKGTQQYGTQQLCSTSCGSSYPYVAMKNGGTCYCLLSLLGAVSTSSLSCNVGCNGYGDVMCGGANAFTVFKNTAYTGSYSSVSSSGSLSTLLLLLSLSSTRASSSLLSLSQSSSQSTASASETTLASLTSGLLQTSSASLLDALLSSASLLLALSAAAGSLGKSSNVGPIVGGVVGGLAAVALIGVGIFFFMRLRGDDDDDDEKDIFKGPEPLRTRLAKFNSVFDMPMANPFVHPLEDDKRVSRADGLVDPRLNPAMVGRRRILEGLLADEADYLRKILGVVNP